MQPGSRNCIQGSYTAYFERPDFKLGSWNKFEVLLRQWKTKKCVACSHKALAKSVVFKLNTIKWFISKKNVLII